MSRFTLEELVQMELDAQDRAWAMWEDVQKTNPKGVELGFFREPAPRKTEEQIAMSIQMRGRDQHVFSMSNVVTGARRKWKR